MKERKREGGRWRIWERGKSGRDVEKARQRSEGERGEVEGAREEEQGSINVTY